MTALFLALALAPAPEAASAPQPPAAAAEPVAVEAAPPPALAPEAVAPPRATAPPPDEQGAARQPARVQGVMTPLPPPPPPVDPESIDHGPWRGNFWFGARADLTVPLGGGQPARGTAVAGGGSAEFGVRLHNVVGLRTGIGFTVHDAAAVRVEDIYGNRFTTLSYGQLTTFELLGLRGFVPVRGRFQPYLDFAGGVVIYLPPGTDPSRAGGLFRGALGFDGWVSPNVALGADAAYRLVSFQDSVGHALTMSFHLSTHF